MGSIRNCDDPPGAPEDDSFASQSRNTLVANTMFSAVIGEVVSNAFIDVGPAGKEKGGQPNG